MSERAEAAAAERALSDESIVFPAQEFKLLSGERIAVYPWGLETGALVLERLEELQAKLTAAGPKAAADWTPRALLAAGWDEVVELVALSCEVDVDEIKRPMREGGWAFEDMLRATEAVLEVCLLRSDGGGALPLLLSLVETMTQVVSRSAGPALARRSQRNGGTRSTGSNGKGTSKARSPRSSGSRRRKGARK